METRQKIARSAGSHLPKNLSTEVGSILLFALSVFTLFALLTYNPGDPSLFSNAKEVAFNSCGRVGAFVSSLLLQCFGMGAFLFPAAQFFLAAAVYKREGSLRLYGTLGGMTVAVMALTVFLTLQWKYWPYSGTLILTGGAFGAWVAEALVKQFNPLGSSIVSLLVFVLAIVLSTPVSVAKWGAIVFRFLGNWAWRALKLAGTYLLFMAGIIAMRVAHAAGDTIQKLLEGAIRRIQERTKAMGLPKEKPAALLKEEIPVEAEVVETKKKKSPEPVIGLEAEDDEAEEDEEDLDEEEDEPVAIFADADAEKKAKEGFQKRSVGSTTPNGGLDDRVFDTRSKGKGTVPIITAAPSVLEPTISEAPNVLPELEQGITKATVKADATPSPEPQILPPEKQKQLELASEEHITNRTKAEAEARENLVAKVSSKIAKMANRGKHGQWKLPTVEFLRKPPKVESSVDRDRLLRNSEILKQKFADFGIDGEVTAVRPGPVITLYEFKPGPGVKVSRIAALADDLSMALSAQSVRILAPLPGKAVVGIEIPSDQRETVYMREFLQNTDFFGPKHSIPVVMGKDIGGATYLSDLARMPHLLCAGQTGSGKSVFMNGLICSLLYRFTPDELRMILVDPKFIEFRAYQDIPHLLLPVVDDPKHAAVALKWAVREMERRYRILAKMGARNLASFNQKVEEMGADVVRDLLLAEENQEDEGPRQQISGGDWIEAFEPDETGAPRIAKLPYIVVIIDELADLMMIAKKEVEISIARIAQKARAAGIHLVIATQRPSTDVVTGLIKANLPSRASFQLASYIDSKTILDRAGAERLLGQGDMLFIPPGVSQSIRLHGAYVDDEEINKVTSFLKSQGKPAYRDEILLAADEDEGGEEGDEEDQNDELFEEAVELVKRSGHASASFLQRHLKVGYNRAARMIETMEMRGIVGPADGARPREVLIR